jgi:hypothetical protein
LTEWKAQIYFATQGNLPVGRGSAVNYRQERGIGMDVETGAEP